jgi:predicted dehydrogenase
MIGLDGHPTEITGPLDQLPDVEIAAISEPSEETVRRFVKGKPRLAGTRYYADARRMLDEVKPDLVAVCNDNGARAGSILECTARRLPFIAEKPYATKRVDLDRVKRAIGESGVKAGMLLPMRYDPPYRALRAIVESGEIGEVLQISSQKSYILGDRPEWFKRETSYGSTILWIGVHMIDLMLYTSGRKFTHASSFMGRVGFPSVGEMETTTASSFRMDNGGTASLHMDYSRPQTAGSHGDDRLRLAGTKGVAEYMAATGVTLMTGASKPRLVEKLPAKGSVFVDYIRYAFGGDAPTLRLDEIYAACDATLAAHEAAVEGVVRRV